MRGGNNVPSVIEVSHPLVKHHLACLRDRHTPPAEFRHLAQRLSVLLAYEATKDLTLAPREIATPLTPMVAHRLNQRVGLVPILRAGLGMVDPILNLIPTAEVWHLGLYRDETTARPVEYYSKLPATEPVDVAMVIDPMLATGGSITAALGALARWGVKQSRVLSIIASRAGIEAVQEKFPAASIYVCAIDPELDASKFIVPGLGDAGDRIFNTLRTS
jgi:uracil phosphoribosyltransferase